MFALLVKLIVRKLIPTAGILGEAETVPHETSSFTGLNDVLRKTLLWEAKSNCRSVYSFCELQWRQNETNKRHIESGVETNRQQQQVSRASGVFSLLYVLLNLLPSLAIWLRSDYLWNIVKFSLHRCTTSASVV